MVPGIFGQTTPCMETVWVVLPREAGLGAITAEQELVQILYLFFLCIQNLFTIQCSSSGH